MYTEPLVTIAIPTYKRVDYLRQALKSAVLQTYPHLEILVSDNANELEAELAVREMCDPRIRYIPQLTNLGMTGNWDALVEEAQGDYFIVLSDDDLLMNSTISGLVNGFEKYPQCVFSFCGVQFINSEGQIKGTKLVKGGLYSGLETILAFLQGGNSPFLCGTLYNRKKFMRTTRFRDTSCQMASDAVAWMKMCLAYNAIVAVDEVYCEYRIHGTSQSSITGIEGWKNDLEQLKIEVIKTLTYYGYSLGMSELLDKKFSRHCAGLMCNIIVGVERESFTDVITAWRLITHYCSYIIPNLGIITYFFMFVRVSPYGIVNKLLRHLKKKLASNR